MMMKKKKRKMEEEMQDLDAKIEEATEQVVAKI